MGPNDRVFPFADFFFFFKQNGKISYFWTKNFNEKLGGKQEKIKIFKLFSGNFGNKMFLKNVLTNHFFESLRP